MSRDSIRKLAHTTQAPKPQHYGGRAFIFNEFNDYGNVGPISTS